MINWDKVKILHGPTDTAGLAVGLAKAERSIGLNSDAIIYTGSNIGSASSNNYSFVKNFEIPQKKREFGSAFEYYYVKSLKLINTLPKILPILMDYDIINLTFSKSFLTFPIFGNFLHELAYLKQKGKKIFVTYQGCDVRRQDIIGKYPISICQHCDICSNKSLMNLDNSVWAKKKRVKRFEIYADRIFYHNPDLANFINRGFFRPYSKMDYREWLPEKKQHEKIVIGHAPVGRGYKGTEIVLNVMNKILKQRNDVEFVLTENIPYNKIKQFYQSLDLYIDQLYLGWYGGVGTELMSLEVPVMTYLRDADFKNVPQELIANLPIINVNAQTLEEKINYYLDNKEELAILSHKSREFVQRFHDPLKIAEFMKTHYQDVLSGIPERDNYEYICRI